MRVTDRRLCTRGQALVEFALVLPLILLLLVGILEFGRAWNEHQIVTDAARAAARTAALADPTVTVGTIQAVVDTALAYGGIDPRTAQRDLPDPSAPEGTPMTVEIRVPYRFFLVGTLLNWATNRRSVTLTARATMRKE